MYIAALPAKMINPAKVESVKSSNFFSVMMAAMQPLLNELEDWLSYYGDEYGYYDNFDDSYNYNFGDDYNAGDNGDLFGDDWPDFYGEEAPAANAA